MIMKKEHTSFMERLSQDATVRLFVQLIVFVFMIAISYATVKQDIALLNQRVEAVEDQAAENKTDLGMRLNRIEEKLDRLIER